MKPATAAAPESAMANSTLEAHYKQARALLRTMFTAEPVMYDGQQTFVKALSCQNTGSAPRTNIYLAGRTAPVNPSDVQILEQG